MCVTHESMITKCLFITAVMLPFLADTRAIASTIEEAQKLQQVGRYSEAITVYEKVLTETPKDTAAAVNQAYCYERIGDFRLAAEKYSVAITNGKTSELLTSRGVCYVATEQFELAKADFEDLLSMEQSNGVALFGLGVAFAGLGNKAESEKLIAKAIDLDAQCYDKMAGRMLGGGNKSISIAIARFIGEFAGAKDHSDDLARLSQNMSLALLHPGYRAGRRYIIPESTLEYKRTLEREIRKTLELVQQDAETLKTKKIDPTQLKADRLNGNWIASSVIVKGNVVDVSNGEHTVIVEMNGQDLTLIVDGERMVNVLHQIETEQPALSIDNAVWGEVKGKMAGLVNVEGWCLHQRLELNPGTTVEIMAIKIGERDLNDPAKKKYGDPTEDRSYDFQAILIRNKHTQLLDSVTQFLVALPAEYAELQGEWALVRADGKPCDPVKYEFVGRRLVRHYIARKLNTPQTMIYDLELNAGKIPAEIDWIRSAMNAHKLGIYSLKGDELKMVLARSREPRPKSFEGPFRKDIDQDLVFKRVRK